MHDGAIDRDQLAGIDARDECCMGGIMNAKCMQKRMRNCLILFRVHPIMLLGLHSEQHDKEDTGGYETTYGGAWRSQGIARL